MLLLRLLLLPFSLLYGIGVFVRNRCYDLGIFKSIPADIPTIVVGNLAVGGSGKSPITEYLLNLLQTEFRVAALSRGYGRSTSGYLDVNTDNESAEVGDEPLQFKHKFPHLNIAVCEDRVAGVQRLYESGEEVVVLDDAFQHRSLQPGFSILLFDYNRLFEHDFLLPAGREREPFSERKRADVLLVTKTPKIFSPMERRRITNYLNPFPEQKVMYAYLEYGKLRSLYGDREPAQLAKSSSILLVTGIARPELLADHLEPQVKKMQHLAFSDHHAFDQKDVERIATAYAGLPGEDKCILTTEKDAMRLKHPKFASVLGTIPVFYLPIAACLHADDKQAFDDLILNYVRKSRKDRSLYPKES